MDVRVGYIVIVQSTQGRHMVFRARGTVDILL